MRRSVLYSFILWCLACTPRPLVTVRPKRATTPSAPLSWAVALHRRSKYIGPQPQYKRWYDELVAACGCEPKTPYEAIAFQMVPGVTFKCDVWNCDGAYILEYDMLFVTSAYANDERVMKHEMLHAILGRGDHPALFKQLGLADADGSL